ncbi:hypothetical protein LPW11_18080 [Geomonas sp. RF6]|uniref:hypothetical protein n=1 Tax=Geomonas sp. RF6 TaxID=2897342 RepID=UPI001E48BBF3|nr:hypothetical protein [Geomonas sp. RF6]UFS69787.1 hypothetical protein LPW11_18080 [Geomonas sp. RF6]
MYQAAPDIFKVDDEDGMVTLYKRLEESFLAVTFGDICVPVKLIGHATAEEAAAIASFKEMIKTMASREAGEAA